MLLEPGVERGGYHDRKPESREFQSLFAGSGTKVPRIVVLDNAGLHTSHVVRRARRGLAAAGVYLYFLPPYAPELNEIEPVFRQVKYHEIPRRSHTTRAALRAAVDTGFDGYGRCLKSKSEKKPRRAA